MPRNMRMTVMPIVPDTLGTVRKGLERRLEELEIKETRPSSIVKIGQNTEKSPGDLNRLAITQTPVKAHQLKLARKTCKV